MLFHHDGGLLELLTMPKMLFVVAAADQPCRRSRQRLPSRGLMMVSLVICRRFDLLFDRTQFDLRLSLFAHRRRRRQWLYLLPSSRCFPGQQTQGVLLCTCMCTSDGRP
jgi:hypothetical protein